MNDLNLSFLKNRTMPDVQASVDERAMPIEQVGIRGTSPYNSHQKRQLSNRW